MPDLRIWIDTDPALHYTEEGTPKDVDDGASEPVNDEPRDEFIGHVLTTAGVPWLSVCPEEPTEVRQLRQLIRQRLK